MTRTQPRLNPVPLSEVIPLRRGTHYITMSRKQWDSTLRQAYEGGWVLLLLDDDERPIAAYCKSAACS